MSGSPANDGAHVGGNAPEHIKGALTNQKAFYTDRYKFDVKDPYFFEVIQGRIRVAEIWIRENEVERGRMEGRVVLELEVCQDMLNEKGALHTGCSVGLFNTGTTLALHALMMSKSVKGYFSLSQSMNIIFHSPAHLGDKLRLVATTLTTGSRTHSATVQIWDTTHHRLIASGTETKTVGSSLPTPRL